jgi:hypothetical protein
LALPAKALSFIAKNVNAAFKKSPSSISYPSSSFDANAPSIWRGIRSSEQFDVKPNGDLLLKPASNFGGKTHGISFTDSPEVAWSYATRRPESIVPNPDGVVFRVKRDLFEDIDDFLGPSTTKPKLKYEGIEGEHAFYTREPFVVPRGAWEVRFPESSPIPKAKEKLNAQVRKFAEMDDRKFMKLYGDAEAKMELMEHTGGVDPFGFDQIRALQESIKHSDAIEQVIFGITGGDNRWALDLALRAKIKARGSSSSYIDILSRYADESEAAYLYGRGWFKQYWKS